VELEREKTRNERRCMGYWNEKILELISIDMTEDPDEGTPRESPQEEERAFTYGVSESAKAKAKARYEDQSKFAYMLGAAKYQDQCMDLETSRGVDLTQSLGK
jgi:hypothetical protein